MLRVRIPDGPFIIIPTPLKRVSSPKFAPTMVIDIMLIIFAVVSFWLGYTKGIVATLFSILEWVVASLLTIALSPYLSGMLIRLFNMKPMLALLLGTFVFFLILIYLIKWLTKKMEASLKKGKLSGSTKILGGIVMMIVGILFYSVFIWLANYYGLINEKTEMASFTYKTLNVISSAMNSLVTDLKPVFQRYWELIQNSVGKEKSPTPG